MLRGEPCSHREKLDKEVVEQKNMDMRPGINSCTRDQTNQGQDQRLVHGQKLEAD